MIFAIESSEGDGDVGANDRIVSGGMNLPLWKNTTPATWPLSGGLYNNSIHIPDRGDMCKNQHKRCDYER